MAVAMVDIIHPIMEDCIASAVGRVFLATPEEPQKEFNELPLGYVEW